jgi:hypothetical protein
MKQRAGRSDDNPRRSKPKAKYDRDTHARSSLGFNLHAQLESIRTNSECKNKLRVNLVDIVLKLSNEIRILR